MARSTQTKQLFAHWFGAIVWNALTVPMGVALLMGGLDDLPTFVVLVIYGFAGVGVVIFARAVVQTARALRFRGLRLVLDPVPGSLGGQIGGSLELPVRPDDARRARVTLHCIHSHVRGTGDNRRRREDVVWSAQTVPDVARSARGTRLSFVFDVPDPELPESEVEEGDHHYWSVHVAAELRGADLDHSFVVPVYGVQPPLRSSLSFTPPEPGARDLAEGEIVAERTARGLTIDYRRGRYGIVPYALLAFGSLCIGSGGFVFASTGGIASDLGLFGWAVGGVFLVVFGLVGLLVVAFALRMLSLRLTVEIEGDTIRATKSFLLFRSTREASLSELDRIEAEMTMQTGQGGGAKTAYAVHGVLGSGARIALGDGIRGALLLDRVRELLEAETGVGMTVRTRRSRGQ